MTTTGKSKTATRRPRVSKPKLDGLVIEVEEGTCGDGCGQEVNKGRSFKQGHDARLHSMLAKALKAGETEVTFVQGGVATTSNIVTIYDEHNWKMVEPKAPKAKDEQAA